MEDQEITDAQLVSAIRRRLMDEIGASQRGQQSVVNNVYGGGIPSGGGGGVLDRLGNQGGPDISPEERDYFVDIMREDLSPGDTYEAQDPATGQPTQMTAQRPGWRKRVHRFATGKKKA